MSSETTSIDVIPQALEHADISSHSLPVNTHASPSNEWGYAPICLKKSQDMELMSKSWSSSWRESISYRRCEATRIFELEKIRRCRGWIIRSQSSSNQDIC